MLIINECAKLLQTAAETGVRFDCVRNIILNRPPLRPPPLRFGTYSVVLQDGEAKHRRAQLDAVKTRRGGLV